MIITELVQAQAIIETLEARIVELESEIARWKRTDEIVAMMNEQRSDSSSRIEMENNVLWEFLKDSVRQLSRARKELRDLQR